MAKRIGANRLKMVNEKRARRPSRMKKVGKYAGIAALVFGAGFALYTCSPAVGVKISEVFKSEDRAVAAFKIVNCDPAVGAKLSAALEALAAADSGAIGRASVIKAASAIPEIEKVSVGKTRDMEMRVKVTERKPVAIVHDGDIRLIDKKGIRFDASPGQYYDLPLICVSKSSSDTVDLEKFNIVKKASKNVGGDFFKKISQIDLSDEAAVNLIFKSGPTEYTIAPQDIENRMSHVKKMVERIQDEHIEPTRIDMRYRGLAVSTL